MLNPAGKVITSLVYLFCSSWKREARSEAPRRKWKFFFRSPFLTKIKQPNNWSFYPLELIAVLEKLTLRAGGQPPGAARIFRFLMISKIIIFSKTIEDLLCVPFALTRSFLLESFYPFYTVHFPNELFSSFTRSQYYELQPSDQTGIGMCDSESCSLPISFTKLNLSPCGHLA